MRLWLRPALSTVIPGIGDVKLSARRGVTVLKSYGPRTEAHCLETRTLHEECTFAPEYLTRLVRNVSSVLQ